MKCVQAAACSEWDVCRDYGSASLNPCPIRGNPDRTIIGNGTTLPSANCACTGAGQCASVNAANFSTNATGQATLSGRLSQYPFAGLTNQTCFTSSSAGSASDTYRVGITSLLHVCKVLPHDRTGLCCCMQHTIHSSCARLTQVQLVKSGTCLSNFALLHMMVI